MIYIIYFNFEELEKVLSIKSLKFVVYVWQTSLCIPQCNCINTINLTYSSRSEDAFIRDFNIIESNYKFNFKENYNQENSIVFVNYETELEYVKQHTDLDNITITLHVEDSDKTKYKSDFLCLYNFGEYMNNIVPRIDSIHSIVNFIKSNLYV